MKSVFENPIIEIVDFGDDISCDVVTTSGGADNPFGANGDKFQINGDNLFN